MKNIAKYWWVFALRALLLLIIGVISVTAPNMPLETLVFYLGFLSLSMLLISGLVVAMLLKEGWRWVPFALFAVFDGVLAYYCLLRTSAAAYLFIAAISFWAVLMGMGLLVMALRQKGTGRILLVLNGALSLVFAGFVFFNPLKSTSANFMIGFYTILLSLFLIYLSVRVWMAGRSKGQEVLADQANK